MKVYIESIVSLVVLIVFSSCAKELECPNENEYEDINGFHVKWRKQINPVQKSCIREILNAMIKVEGGTFVMGGTSEQNEYARKNEYPLSYNTVSDFYMCKYEILDAQYKSILGNPNEGKSLRSLFLSWNDWQQFIEVLNNLSGLKFDFPTEAQWEYAARGGNKSEGYIYPGSNNIEDVRSPSEIEGSKTPNELGIFNMADLKSEWCKDFYKQYDNNILNENRFVSTGTNHVVRGGNYRCTGKTGNKYLTKELGTDDRFGKFTEGSLLMGAYDYRYCRVSARTYFYYHSNRDIGCRLVINKKFNLNP